MEVTDHGSQSNVADVVTAPPPIDSAPAQFTRNASGLIRSATVWDAFGVNAVNGIFVVGIAWLLLYASLYPGGNVFLATIFAFLVAVPITVVYLKLSVVFPRSGGDYVYNSRLLHPGIGFAGNFIVAIALIYWTAFGGVYVVAYSIAPGLITAGIQLNNKTMIHAGTWISGKAEISVFSVIVIALFGAFLNWGGNKAYFRFQKLALVCGMVAMIACLIVALTVSRSSALIHLNHLFKGMGVSPASNLEKGSTPAFSFKQTFLMIWWPAEFIVSAFWSAYIGGEVKQPGRNQMLGMFGALGWMSAWALVMVGAMYYLFSDRFFIGLSSAFSASTFGPGSTPIYPTLIAGSVGNGYFTLALMACMGIFILVVVGANTLLSTRCIFAWGLDRITPNWFSEVRAKSGAPQSAILVVVVTASVFAVLYTYGVMSVLESASWFLITFFLVMVSAVLLPYRHRTVWESSPGANYFLGIPTIVWWGVLGMVSVCICLQNLWGDSNYGVAPAQNFWQFLLGPILLAGALAYYFVARGVQKRRGVNTDLNFAQIPPE